MNDSDNALTYGRVREIARQQADATLSHYWIPGMFPVDPAQIAKKIGIEVYDAQLGEDVWGMLQGMDNSARIYLDVDQPFNRKRFSCAHEIGHYVSHTLDPQTTTLLRIQPIAPGRAYADRRSNKYPYSVPEVFANEFAASLLVPERELKRQIHADITDNFALASYFKVSLDVIARRRKAFGV